MNDSYPQPPQEPYQPPAPQYTPPPLAPQQPAWPAQAMPTQILATRTDQRVHQVAWAVFWLLMANVCSIAAAVTAFTVVGAVVFGLAAFGFGVTALVYSIMALGRR